MKYRIDDGQLYTERGFRTMNSAMRRLRTLQIQHYPSTIQKVELNQIFDPGPVDQDTEREIEFLDEAFLRAMEDPSK